jgi:inner membrane protein
MATPIGHALGGYAVFLAYPNTGRRDRLRLLGLCIMMAIAPDLDFVPGILKGQPPLYHQGISHSLGFAVLASLVLAVVYSLRNGTMKVDWSLFFFAYLSHLVIDLFGVDGRPPYGIPVFWPLTHASYLAPFRIFAGVHHASSASDPTGEWIANVFHPANIRVIGIEVLVMAPVVLLMLLIRHRSRLRVSDLPRWQNE